MVRIADKNQVIRVGFAGGRRFALAAAALLALAIPALAQTPNTRASRILGMFDINGLGGPDESIDSDGDGLPDTWESGGLDPENSAVAFPAPPAIVPGSPPVSLFSRRPVRTLATARDTDGDGLTDFIEVFGLKFIDDNGDGILDDAAARDATGAVIFDGGRPVRATDASGQPTGEWFDFNGDGMPSIGEYPAVNVLIPGASQNFDFDGFVYTDPTLFDTDGDGVSDGADNDPLVNPRTFGEDRAFFSSDPSGTLADPNDVDFDNDGLGNGMDLGNDVIEQIDNPTDLLRVIEILRPDLLQQAVVAVPEGLIEDLLGADFNGDGLFRLTDIETPHFGLIVAPSFSAGSIDLFAVEDPNDPNFTVPLGFALTLFPAAFEPATYYTAAERLNPSAGNASLPWQEFLAPAGRNDNLFLPDPRIWTVLYAYRMPGFDIDGNGFIGYDSSTFTGALDVNGTASLVDPENVAAGAPSSVVRVSDTSLIAGLDGQVEVSIASFPCLGALLSLTIVGLCGLRAGRRR